MTIIWYRNLIFSYFFSLNYFINFQIFFAKFYVNSEWNVVLPNGVYLSRQLIMNLMIDERTVITGFFSLIEKFNELNLKESEISLLFSFLITKFGKKLTILIQKIK